MKKSYSDSSTEFAQPSSSLETFPVPLQEREASTKFLSAIAHTGTIWIKASWDLSIPPPANWPLKKDGSPVNYVYTGTVNAQGFSLILCEYAGSDENANSIWQPTGQHYSDGFAHCLDLSHAGATIYFYPNQPQGGISNAHVEETDLLFYEIDDLSREEQWEALRRLQAQTGLVPAAVVFTGGKSLHVYFRLTENVSPSEWQRRNRKLTIIQNSDPAICNPNRAMRFPGLVRRKVVNGQLSEPIQITLEQFSDAAYTPEDFEARLDALGLFPHGLSDERWRQWQRAKRDGQDTTAILQKPESELVPKYVPAAHAVVTQGVAVLLEKLVTKDDRAFIDRGAGEGNRDNTAYKAARNLIATEIRAQELGIPVHGDSRQIWEGGCDRCTPSLPARDRERIWRSASRGNPSPTLSDDAIQECAAAYQRRENGSIRRTAQLPAETPEPDPELYANYEAWESQQELIEEEAHKERKRQWTAAQPDRVRGEWLRLSQLVTKLAKEVCERYLNIDPAHDFLPGINAWASPMGTGKTHNLAKIVDHFKEGNLLSYRNSLLQNTVERIPGVDFIHDLGGTGYAKADRALKNHSAWTALCIDSIVKVRTKDVLVLEEAGKLVDHLLLGATCKRERAQTTRLFEKHIREAKHVFILDADLNDRHLRYIKSLDPSKPVHIIKNTYQPWQWQVNWFMGQAGNEEGSNPKPNDKTLIEKIIIDSPAGLRVPLLVTDSQMFAEATDRHLIELYGDQGLRVDSITKTDDADRINTFLADPNKWIEENQPSWLILSPTAESSLDITIEHFTDVFGVFFGVINCYSMRQMLGRYRVPIPRHVFVRERSMSDNGGSRSPFAKTVEKHLHKYHRETIEQIALEKHIKEQSMGENDGSVFTLIKALSEIVDIESETWKDPHLKALAEAQASDNYQKSNCRQTLREMLESCGHKIREVFGATDLTTGHKRIKEEIQLERSERIANAKDISIEEAREIQRNMSASTDERYAAKKAVLKDRCPGIEVTSDFVYWCEFKNRGILNQLQNYFMYQNSGLSEKVDRRRWAKALDNGTFLADIRTQSLELQVLRDLGIEKLLDGKERGEDDPEILAFQQKAIALSKRVKTAFGVTVKEDSNPNYLIKRVLKKIGVDYAGKQYRDGEARYRLYSAVLPETEANSRAVLTAYAIRYADLIEQPAPPFVLSQTEYAIENTSFEQSVTKAGILPAIEPELIDTTIKGLSAHKGDQLCDEDALYVAQHYLPDVARDLESSDGVTDPREELAAIRSGFGTKYLAILAATPPPALTTILKHIVRGLPAAILKTIRPDELLLA